MKKVMSYIAIAGLVLTFTACGNKDNEVIYDNPIVNEEVDVQGNETENKEQENNVQEENKEIESKPTEDKKPVENKPEEKPEDKKPVENKPEEKPVENKPVEELPDEKPQEEPKKEENLSVGNILLNEFKEKAGASNSVEELANSLVTNPVIPFMGGAMPVEEGLLQGFDNAEIKGFKSGAVFMPMIGSIPFIGYVFELNDGVDASTFISTLESNANLRWNVCVTADEMVSGSVGNKVFFVMAPLSFGE